MKLKLRYSCSSRRFYPKNFISCILMIFMFVVLWTPRIQSENTLEFKSSPFPTIHHKGHFAKFLLQFALIQDKDFCPFSFYLKNFPNDQYHHQQQESLYWHVNSWTNENGGYESDYSGRNFTNFNSNQFQPLISFVHEAENFAVKRNKNKTSSNKTADAPSFDLWNGKPIHKLTAQCTTFIYPLKIKTKTQTQKQASVVNSLAVDLFNLGNFARDRFIIVANQNKDENAFKEIIEHLPSRKIRFLIGILLGKEEEEMRKIVEINPNLRNSRIPRMSLSRINLNGIHFRMSAVTIPPLIMQHNGQIYDGMMRSLYMAAAANFNYTYETTEEKEGTGRKLANGTWIGSLADLKRGKFDMAAVIRMSGQRQGHIDITNYLWNDQPVFLVAVPQAYIPLTALIGPFTAGVWLMILASFTIVVCYIFLSSIFFSRQQYESQTSHRHSHHKKHSHPLSTEEKLYQSILIPLALFLDQGVDEVDKTTVKPVVALWMMLAFVLGVGYKDKLFSFLTFPQEEVIPRNLIELHERPDYQINLYYWKSALFNMLNSSEYPIHQSLVQRLDLIPDNSKCVLSAILKPKTVCIAVKSLLAITMASNATISYGLEAGVLSERILNMDPMSISIGLQKNSIFTESWNIVSVMFRDTGIFSKWEMDTFANFRRKGKAWLKGQEDDNQVKRRMESLYVKYNTRVKPLELSNFYAILGVYIICVIICLLVFVYEKKPWVKKGVHKIQEIRKLKLLNPDRRWKMAKILFRGLSLPTGGKVLNWESANKLSTPSSSTIQKSISLMELQYSAKALGNKKSLDVI